MPLSRVEGLRGWPGPATPGIPLRSRSARPRPPYAEAKGDGRFAACASGGGPASCRAPSPGIPRERRFARSRPFRWERKGQGVCPRSALLDSCLRRNDGVGGNEEVRGDGGDGPSPPRASPCGLAPLVRVPLTLERRGTVGLVGYVRGWRLRAWRFLAALDRMYICGSGSGVMNASARASALSGLGSPEFRICSLECICSCPRDV